MPQDNSPEFFFDKEMEYGDTPEIIHSSNQDPGTIKPGSTASVRGMTPAVPQTRQLLPPVKFDSEDK